MKNFRKSVLAIISAAGLLCSVSCGEKGLKSTMSASDNSELATTAEEADLGEYVLSDDGIKLYYDSETYSAELMATLEKYFVSFSENDYDSYLECIQSDYVEMMNSYLEENYGYDLETSFNNQCDSLKEQAGGDYTVTRIKAEAPETDGSDDFMTSLQDAFGENFCNTVKNKSDALHDVAFYLMVNTGEEETLLLSEYEIVFSEEDGKYYTFG